MLMIPIDTGNKAIKTENFEFHSGITALESMPGENEEALMFQDKYYRLSHERNVYLPDKTLDDRYYLLTLFAIAKELEKLRHKQYVAERKLTAAKHKEKRLQSELKWLTRSERTHRLCTRAGMLETFLKEPTVLTDEDVMELLTFIFQSEAVHKKLNLLIESRRETQEADEGENP